MTEEAKQEFAVEIERIKAEAERAIAEAKKAASEAELAILKMLMNVFSGYTDSILRLLMNWLL